MSLMPCFTAEQAPVEGVIVGHLMTGYGELELVMCKCLIAVEGMIDLPIKQLFNIRGAESRIKAARKVMMSDYAKAGLDAYLAKILDDMEWCRKIRNQYAHCHWYWTLKEGLCFVDLEAIAKQPRLIMNLLTEKKQLTFELLKEQHEFFFYVKQSFEHVARLYLDWDRSSSPLALKRPISIGAKPQEKTRPPLHN
jgi:hypothetical protein